MRGLSTPPRFRRTDRPSQLPRTETCCRHLSNCRAPSLQLFDAVAGVPHRQLGTLCFDGDTNRQTPPADPARPSIRRCPESHMTSTVHLGIDCSSPPRSPSKPEREVCPGHGTQRPPTGKYRVAQVQSRPVVSAESDPRVLRHHTVLRNCNQRRHVAFGAVASRRARCLICWSSVLAWCHDRWTLVDLRASVQTLRIVRRRAGRSGI